MTQENEISNENNAALTSPVWSDPNAQNEIAINVGAKVAAYFSECGQVVIIQQGMGLNDQVIDFEHDPLRSLIDRLVILAAENPKDYYCDEYREALLICADDRS